MTISRIPNLPFPHLIDVIRQGDGDDGSGGIIPQDRSPLVYENRRCRIALMSGEDQQEGFGNVSDERWKVVVEFSPNIRDSDFIRVSFGRYPNISGPLGLPDLFPPTVSISTPGGVKILNWNETDQRYQTGDELYLVYWNATEWTFRDLSQSEPFVHDFEYFERHHNLFLADWAELVGEEYSVVSRTGPSRTYRIVLIDNQKDDIGDYHHTSVVMELEDADG